MREKPVKAVRFGKDASSIVMPYARYDEVRDLTWLYSLSFDWLAGTLEDSSGGRNERSD